MIWRQFLLMATLSLAGLVPLRGEESVLGDIWMVQQDYIKFGKKEVYETSQQDYFVSFASYLKKKVPFPCYAMQDLDSPEYLYFIPVSTYGGVGSFLNLVDQFQNTFSSEERSQKMLLRDGTLNFFYRSLYVYLPACSSVPKGMESFFAQPFVSYFLFGIVPGQEATFENHLTDQAAAQKKTKSPACWRVWRIAFGGDSPKYMVVVYGDSQKQAEESAKGLAFITGPLKQLLRKEKLRSAAMRPDLSLK